MNTRNRRALADAERLFSIAVNASIGQLRDLIEGMPDDETEKLDNLPEPLQEAPSGQCIADAIEMLEEKLDALECISEEIENYFSS